MSRDHALRILFVHAGAEMYGADRILLELTSGLVGRGHTCWAALPSDGVLKGELERVGVRVSIMNMGVLRRKYFSMAGLVNRSSRLLRAVRHLQNLIVTEHIDVVHSNTTAVFAGALAARLCRKPHVWHVHEITTRPRWFASFVARVVGWLSDRVVFVSDATREHLCRINPALNTVAVTVYNGIDTTRATGGTRGTLRFTREWGNDVLIVGMIGRINWWKGQDRLLDCAELLLPRFAELRFLLVGGVFAGEENLGVALQERARALGAVAVEGFRPDVANVLADIDIFVLPSTAPDPFPTVVLEAMAAAKPIVAFAHGGVCEMVVDGDSGLLCTPASVPAMANAIESLVSDAGLRERLGARAKQRVTERFTSKAFLDSFEGLYLKLAESVRK